MSLLYLILPRMLMGNELGEVHFKNMHTWLYHTFLIATVIPMIIWRMYSFDFKTSYISVSVFTVFLGICFVGSLVFNYDYFFIGKILLGSNTKIWKCVLVELPAFLALMCIGFVSMKGIVGWNRTI